MYMDVVLEECHGIVKVLLLPQRKKQQPQCLDRIWMLENGAMVKAVIIL